MRSRLDEVYKCETGFIARDQNLKNAQFGIGGYVGGLALRRVIVQEYSPREADLLLKVMTTAERTVKRVFEDGQRIVVSDGRVLQINPTESMSLALGSRGFITGRVGDIDQIYGTEFVKGLDTDWRRHVAIVAPSLRDRMNFKADGPFDPVRLDVNGVRSDIAKLDVVINGLMQRIKDRTTKLALSSRRPFKYDEVILQSLYDLIRYKKDDSGVTKEDSSDDVIAGDDRWSWSRLIGTVVLQASWRVLDRS